MFCPHCGTNNAVGQFCTKCGSGLNTNGAQGMQSAQTQAPFQSTVQGSGQVSNGFSTAAIALGAVSFLFFPIIFGPVGIVLAAVAKSKNEPRAMIGLSVSIAGTVLGMLFGLMVTSGY